MQPDVKAREYNTYINNLRRSNRDFLNFCYGYSTRVSALQLITFYNAVGAGGRMVKPLFCRAIVDGDRVEEIQPIVLNKQIAPAKKLAVMREMLEGVVENGTGNNIKNNTYGIAGKTGTAVTNYSNRHRYNASFAGFFPSEKPRYTCLVMIENVESYGRQAAVVFKSIADCVVAIDKNLSEGGVKSVWPRLSDDIPTRNLQPTVIRAQQQELMNLYKTYNLPYYSSDSSQQWVVRSSDADGHFLRFSGYKPAGGRVPNCYGMTAKDAIEMLHSVGLKVSISGYGRVISQSPAANQAIKPGATIALTLNPNMQ